MKSTRIEESWGRGAETATFVEVVKANDPVLGIRLFSLKETHRNAHPEELRSFHPPWFVARFVDVQVAIIKGRYAEEIEVKIGRRIEGIGKAFDIILIENILAQASDLDPMEKVSFEVLTMSFLKGFDAIGLDVPRQDFLVDVGEKDAARKLGHVSILFKEGLRIKNDGFLQVLT